MSLSANAGVFTELLAASREVVPTTELFVQVMQKYPSTELFTELAQSYSGESVRGFAVLGEHSNITWSADAAGTHTPAVDAGILTSYVYEFSKLSVATVQLNTLDLEKNAGGYADMAKAHMNAAKLAGAKQLATALHAITPTSGTVESFHTLISDTGTVGAISPSDWASWVSVENVVDSDTTTIDKAFRDQILDMEEVGAERPTHILCGRAIFSAYQERAAALGQYIFTSKAGDIDLGFMALNFEGIEVRFDPQCRTDVALFIYKPSLICGYLNDKFLSVEAPRPISGNLNYEIPIVSSLVVGVNSRYQNSKLTWNSAGTGS